MRQGILKTLCATVALTSMMAITSLAGTWKQDTTGWWYQNEDGGYARSTWTVIDGKSYYFNDNGYMLCNSMTPDGYYVGVDGSWDGQPVNTVPAVPETPVVAETQAIKKSASTGSGISSAPYDGYSIIVNTNTNKYHVPSCRYAADIKPANLGYCSDAAYLNSNGYAACKRCH